MDIGLNWLWQGAVVALAAAALLRMIPRSRTPARYGVAWAACAAVVVLPAMSLLGSEPAAAAGGGALPAATVVAVPLVWWTSRTTALALWTIWAVASGWRSGLAILALRRAKRQAREFPADLEARLPHWGRLRATGRRVRLMLSHRVRTAGVLGGGAPVIAVAPALLEHLTEADLDRVVTHEWAHIQRRDDVAQIAQLVVRAVAGWHPAVWWLERQLHLEREVACDEMAVLVTGSAKAYATCLTRLAAIRATPVPGVPVLAAVSSSGLRQRVIRILAPRPQSAHAWRFTPLVAALAMGALAVLVGRMQVVDTVLASAGVARAVLADSALAVVSRPPVNPQSHATMRSRDTGRATRSRPAPTGSQAESAQYAPAAQSTDAATEPLGATTPLGREAIELPAAVVSGGSSETSPSRAAAVAEPNIWDIAGGTGKAIGAGSERAAIATAGFFTRVGKNVARSF